MALQKPSKILYDEFGNPMPMPVPADGTSGPYASVNEPTAQPRIVSKPATLTPAAANTAAIAATQRVLERTAPKPVTAGAHQGYVAQAMAQAGSSGEPYVEKKDKKKGVPGLPSARRARKRAQFGVGYSTGVAI